MVSVLEDNLKHQFRSQVVDLTWRLSISIDPHRNLDLLPRLGLFDTNMYNLRYSSTKNLTSPSVFESIFAHKSARNQQISYFPPPFFKSCGLAEPYNFWVRIHHTRYRLVIDVAVSRVKMTRCCDLFLFWMCTSIGPKVTFPRHLILGTLVLNWPSITMRQLKSTSTPMFSRLRPLMYGPRPMAMSATPASS